MNAIQHRIDAGAVFTTLIAQNKKMIAINKVRRRTSSKYSLLAIFLAAFSPAKSVEDFSAAREFSTTK
ncbi:MAG: hypothetical protein Q7K57_08555 [Burkholderiaceae bacterium]|nr:hypothetical protein [Burkholderiaceae bacterium]